MINKISKLKNFGIFHDFTWKTELPEFKKFNLIYGWNRSGKTTISRVFESCEKKSIYDKDKFKQYPENGEFEIKVNDNLVVKNTDVINSSIPMKVFSQDFIDENVSFDPSNSCNPIIYISEEDIESKKQLEKLKSDAIVLIKEYDDFKRDKISKEDIKNSFLTGVGREIANILFNKSYNKTNVESRINIIGIDNFTDKILTEEDKKKYETISKSEPEKVQIDIPSLKDNNFSYLSTRVNSLINKRVVAELLERLKDPDDKDGGLDEELNNWVKQGFDIHKNKNQFKKCLFCENNLSNNFFDSLAKHFSKDYDDLQNSIQFLIKDLRNLKLMEISEKNIELYLDLRNNYEVNAKEYNKIINRQNKWLFHSEALLEQKYKNPFDPDLSEMTENPENYSNLLNDVVEKLNKIILEHNQRVKNHHTEVLNSKEKLELNSIAIALLEQDYKKYISDLKEAESKEKESLEKLNINNLDISKLEKSTSNIGVAIEKINKHLKEFFGKEEIKLQLDDSKKGYVIKRDGQLAKNLSEGEKTAIAFSYFIVKVEEKEFKIKEGLIFIDDPISSFDSNFIYHCFSLIKNHFGDVGQLFISTHNFQLFNLVKDWFISKNRNTEEKNIERKLKGQEEKEIPCEFYMVKNDTIADKRTAKLIALDKTLKDFKSEYTFLFSLLKEFNEKTEDPEFEEIYNIANIGRRFFDIYADFKIPTNSKQPKDKICLLVEQINKTKSEDEQISKVVCDKVFWLINGFSHNSDPTSAIEHKDKNEVREAIKILFNIIKESDFNHYKILEDNTK